MKTLKIVTTVAMQGVIDKLTPEDEKGMAAYFAQYQWLEKQK